MKKKKCLEIITLLKRKSIYYFCILSLFFTFNIETQASHVSGGSITYKCLGPDSFEINLTFFRDCIGMGMSSIEPIYYYSKSCGDTLSTKLNLTRVSIKNVSQICPKDSLKSSCIIGSSGYQGYEEHTYSGILKLPKQCNDWVVYYTTAYNFYARNKAITNLANTGSYAMYAIIDNTNSKCNDSPYYTAPYPIAYVCVNQPTTYSFGSVETNGDSLAFDLFPALNWNLAPIAYIAPWSDTLPIDGVVNDPVTGLLSFTPTTLGVFVVTQRVREYDTLGNMIGMTMRDIQIVVDNCNPNNPPNATSGSIENLISPAVKTGNYSVELAEGDSLSFYVVIDDPDVNDTLSLESNITAQLPGATFNYVGINPDTAFIKWKVPTGMAGKQKSFTITAKDNFCPIRGQQTYVYSISVIGGIRAGTDSTICKGGSSQLNVTGGTSFKWSVVSGDAIVIGTNFSCDTCTNPIASPSITTVYEVVSDLPSNNRDTVTITVKPVLNAAITAVGPFCESVASFNLTAVDTSGIWSGKGITDTIKGTFNPKTAGFGTHTITYSISSLCGDTDTVKIAVDSLKNATITQAGPYCESNSSVTLQAVHTSGTWSGNGTSSSGIFTPSSAGPGTHTVTYTITGVCNDTDTMKIQVDSVMDATITPPGLFCISDPPDTLKAADPGGTWSGTGITNNSTGVFEPAKNGAGNFLITYTISGVCSAVDTETVFVVSAKDATITPVNPLCASDLPINLQTISAGGKWFGSGITDSINGIFSPSSAGAGTHIITYTISGLCGDNDTVSITVLPLVDATITTQSTLCPDAFPVNLTAVDTGGIWSGKGITDTLNGTFNPVTAGMGTHIITYTISGVCSDTDTLPVIVLIPPSVSIVTKDESCMGCDGTATASVTNGNPPYTYLWDTLTGSQTNFIATNLCAGLYSITVTDSTGCTGNSAATVLLGPTPIASFSVSPQPTSTSNTIMYFTDNSVGNIVQWDWTFYDTSGIALDTRTDENVYYTLPKVAGTYFAKLIITDGDGCTDDTTLQIIIFEDFVIYVPNAFTPNGDGNNDFFGPKGTGMSPDTYYMYIFNRWGELIFESNDLTVFWDGKANGSKEIVQDGVYIWKIIVNDITPERNRHELIGSVTVLK